MRYARLSEKRYEKKKKAENRVLINSLKDNPCTDCGNRFPVECMDFDHLRDKSFSLSRVNHKATDTVLRELSKCELVCANCHRIRTKARGYGMHGSARTININQMTFNFHA